VTHREDKVLTVRGVHPDLHQELDQIRAHERTSMTDIYNWALEVFVDAYYEKEKANGHRTA
jgi:hypothetical protein